MLTFKLSHDSRGALLQHPPGPACDQCRHKKSACNRRSPCQACVRHDIACSYMAMPKQRGRRPRARPLPSAPAVEDAEHEPAATHTVHTVHTIHTTLNTTQSQQSLDAPVPEATSSMGALPPMEPRRDLPAPQQDDMTSPSFTVWTMNSDAAADALPSDHSPVSSLPWSTDTESFASVERTSSPSRAFCVEMADCDAWFAGCEGPPVAAAVPDTTTATTVVGLPPSALPAPLAEIRMYVDVFFEQLYPVFPVIDHNELYTLLRQTERGETPLPLGMYACLCALSGAVIVQLNMTSSDADATASPYTGGGGGGGSPGVLAEAQAQASRRVKSSATHFIGLCQEARRQQDFIEHCDEWTVLTSFFLFAYHGNLNQSQLSWYYLREAIGFLQALRLDEEDAYFGLPMAVAQRKRRLFWLLFITERAYALQHRRRAVLRPDIELPGIFGSQDPRIGCGFVTLVKLFSSVSDAFVNAWSSQPLTDCEPCPPALSKPHPHHCGGTTTTTNTRTSNTSIELFRPNDVMNVLSMAEIDETQRLDILITEKWLNVLIHQLHNGSNSSRAGGNPLLPASCSYGGGSSIAAVQIGSVFVIAKSVEQLISSASPTSLRCHGIGMEQKVSDIANCLCEALTAHHAGDSLPLPADRAIAIGYLNSFMLFLAHFRNHTSEYFGPLVQRAGAILGTQSLLPALLLPVDVDVGVGASVGLGNGNVPGLVEADMSDTQAAHNGFTLLPRHADESEM
ncbi:uncharacterized protein SPSK_03086 [Sporothrix schenckii 1099-18]|uniref:Zn(2)-C6 fungal-type domain-containing protein n=1 Tax=Sporothrix schenckii 1099-18 TaxID=1397361 RepID=A0A0F2LX72_SPOSC|nr:uncharacterized protein SPSK_03086 [Sporothrix schenckii 1099-18]KJR82063.1 hypothetical protein SPSK_03086 [Sporothrix schenckii 1099-18]